jgi:hypothetical protein
MCIRSPILAEAANTLDPERVIVNADPAAEITAVWPVKPAKAARSVPDILLMVIELDTARSFAGVADNETEDTATGAPAVILVATILARVVELLADVTTYLR